MHLSVRNTLLVMGSANLDFVVRVPHVPAPGETVMGGRAGIFPGGKGANQAVACARAGASTRMLLALGDDANAQPIEESLRAAGVDACIARMRGEPTGMAFISLADNAENAITVAPGANALLRASDLPSLDGVSHLLMQLETPLETVVASAGAARAAGVTVLLNAAPASTLPAELLGAVDVLIVNEGELASITGWDGPVATALARLDAACVIVTLGSRGCMARSGDAMLLQPAFDVEAVDTTAAGDTFCGVLAASLGQGDLLPAALRRASAAAALACMRVGAQASIPDHDRVAAFLASHPATRGDTPEHRALAAYCGLD